MVFLDICQWGDWSEGINTCSKTACGPHYVTKTRKDISDGKQCKNQTITEACPLNDCSKDLCYLAYILSFLLQSKYNLLIFELNLD